MLERQTIILADGATKHATANQVLTLKKQSLERVVQLDVSCVALSGATGKFTSLQFKVWADDRVAALTLSDAEDNQQCRLSTDLTDLLGDLTSGQTGVVLPYRGNLRTVERPAQVSPFRFWQLILTRDATVADLYPLIVVDVWREVAQPGKAFVDDSADAVVA